MQPHDALVGLRSPRGHALQGKPIGCVLPQRCLADRWPSSSTSKLAPKVDKGELLAANGRDACGRQRTLRGSRDPGAAGVSAADDGAAFADGVMSLLARPESLRRAAARARAERYPWSAAVDAFLAAHDAPGLPRATVPADLAPTTEEEAAR